MKEMLKCKATIGFICLMVGIVIICPTTKLENEQHIDNFSYTY